MIPVNTPLLDGNEKAYLAECVDSGWISSEGPFVGRFEAAFAQFTGAAHGVAVANDTAALETALYAVGVGPGDEVLMPSFTIISCALACLRLGARPVLTDIAPLLWTMDPARIEARITPRTKAIMPVHIYGHPVDMDPVLRLAEAVGLAVVEDNAEAQGAEYYSAERDAWLRCGSMGRVSATSFYANKIVTTGEGGMVLTDDPEAAARARSYRNLCFQPGQRFLHEELGYNFRMTNLQAAVGLAQTEQVERFVGIKRANAARYAALLAGLSGVRFMEPTAWARPVYWMYAVELDPELGLDAAHVMARLAERGVGTRPFFRGLHDQPALRALGLFGGEHYPRTDHAHRYGFYLPSGLALTAAEIETVAEALAAVVGRR